MKIIFKHTIKNMISRPLRTGMLLFCILICSFSAMLVFDMSNSLENVMVSFYGQIAGKSDILITCGSGVEQEKLEAAPPCNPVYVANMSNFVYKRDSNLYNYVIKQVVNILGCDLAAADMGLIPKNIKLEKNQVAVTKQLAKDYGYEIGDSILLDDEVGRKVSYEVAYILPLAGMLMAERAALFLLYPYIVQVFSDLLCRITRTVSMPVAHFAAKEISRKKSTAGSGRLCVTAVSICLVLFVISNSFQILYTQDIYDCDIILGGMTEKHATYRYIENMEQVENYEYIYTKFSENEINGQKKNINVFGHESYKYFKGVKDLPEQLGADECVMDFLLAKKLGVRAGENITITFNNIGYFPITKEMRLVGYCDSLPYDCVGQSVVISMELYKQIFDDSPAKMLIKTSDISIKEKIEKYSVDYISEIQTKEMYQEKQEVDASGMKNLFIALIILGTGLTLIGNISNQMIGFEGRKRECAVLLSTSMSRGKLCRLFFMETLFSVGIALCIAIPLGMFLVNPLHGLLEILGITVPIVINPMKICSFIMGMWFTFGITVLFPVKHIWKMNIAEQLKYE